MKKVGLIILALVTGLVLIIGSASAIDAANPSLAKSVQIQSVDSTGLTISYSWEKYGAWSYSVNIVRVDDLGQFETVYDDFSDLGKRTDSFTFGPKWVPAKPGVVLDSNQSFFIFLNLFKKNGDVDTLAVSSW